MIESTIIQIIQMVGFPIVVALWFMFRTEKVIMANTIAIRDLTVIVKTLGGAK